ncbi:MAG TPA: AMP-binding protein [Streptosporangiaceae bacterium]|jgi:long-chain acyl-CoA synthetase|nr:AMP-binding protein [Streptosporangiaceae bacterium]
MASTYRDRPWLRLYQPGKPADITPEHSDALSMWRSGLARFGDRPFLYYFDTPVTAARVEAESDALAAAFAERGLGRGDRVALYLQNMPQFVIGLLAAWKAGGIAVPVNPMLKERELHYVLSDCGASAIVSLQDLWNSVASTAVEGTPVKTMITTSPLDYLGAQDVPPVLEGHGRVATPGAVDLAELVRDHLGARPDPVAFGPSDVALLTYTSGTTGDPKGAMNTHGNVTFNAAVYREWMSLTPDDTVLAGAPLFHITGLIGHIAVAMLVPMPMALGYRFEPATINRLAERHRCTFTVMAITAFTAMANDPTVTGCDLSSLTKAYSGGAPIAPSIVERFEREVGPYIHNVYGLTETTSPSHAVPFGRRAPVDPASGALSVGVPVFNTVVRIVDDDGNDLPPGEIGEIVTSGPMVVPGYWNRPDATQQTLPGGELRTGDVGFMDPDGWFYLVDRKKDMIVASGYKVWPREVEDTLLRHPAVREAAVVGVPDEYRGETVWAYVSLRPGAEATPGELIAFCREQMAAYKYPRHVEVLPELPKTPTGKLLRRELREHARDSAL